MTIIQMVTLTLQCVGLAFTILRWKEGKENVPVRRWMRRPNPSERSILQRMPLGDDNGRYIPKPNKPCPKSRATWPDIDLPNVHNGSVL